MTDTQSARIACEVLFLLRQCGAGKTICATDVARRLPLDEPVGGGWRDWMPAVTAVIVEMANVGMVVVTQRGNSADPDTAAGPVRIGLPQAEHSAG